MGTPNFELLTFTPQGFEPFALGSAAFVTKSEQERRLATLNLELRLRRL